MGTRSGSIGATKDERDRRSQVREGIFGSGKIPILGIGAAFTLLLFIKIIVNGLYLQTNPLPFSAPNIALAQDKPPVEPEVEKMDLLRKKEEELKAKEMLLKKKEENLLPLQKEIDEKLSELNELQARLTTYAKDLADRENVLKDTKLNHIVALYSAMDPPKAAAIMEKLNVDTIVRILAHMKGKSAGQILAVMNPERGAVISEKLSKSE